MTEPDGPTRPEDVDTAFWLWVVALPLLVTGFLTDVVTAPTGVPVVIAFAVYLVIIVVAVVITFLVLMRAGYRWARTVLTAGGLSSIMYVAVNLFVTERSEIAALVYAVTGIFGAVLTAGGIYLLHRRDSHAYFTR
ncbi:hypothetical protein [[Mycobacterium] wendilense]|uniref:Transmembrane protein n=1 Tax=[Mycobacterium] wendilense TaxID=3064284 RepID=A0ABN9P2I8_9MYCO|nr:hypothetical protein [Mycolicibacterium sp. MU0050]CAJ1585603.1 hypothetical protein MU0050_003807 [Mycolicibacterium sp. MU0050]